MSDAASTYLEDKLLNHTLRYSAAPYTGVNTVYVALFSGTAATVKTALESGTSATTVGNWGYYEINNGNYSRQTVTFSAAASGSISSNITVTFPVATSDYNNTAASGSTVTCLAIVDASSGSTNVLFYGELTVAKQVSSGDQFTISSTNLTVQLA